jgi:hypothetical protein
MVSALCVGGVAPVIASENGAKCGEDANSSVKVRLVCAKK